MSDAANPIPRIERPDPCPFHVMMEGSSVPLSRLDAFDVENYLERFRGHLYRAAQEHMGGMPPGVLFASIHGAYDPNTRTYPLHIHGIVTEGKIALIDALRPLPMYQPAVAGDNRDAARTPILMPRQPVKSLASAIGYALKAYWPMRPTFLAPDGLRTAFDVPVMRIREEPACSEYLRFLDKWAIKQTTLIMGMRASDCGLVRL